MVAVAIVAVVDADAVGEGHNEVHLVVAGAPVLFGRTLYQTGAPTQVAATATTKLSGPKWHFLQGHLLPQLSLRL